MSVQEIYERYRIMPGLQLHQLRVAGVARMIGEARGDVTDARDIIIACLFHDMGNIIKSDLERFPEFLEPKGFAYWEQVKKDYLEKYGNDEHHATVEIARDIPLPAPIIVLVEGVGFSSLEYIRDQAPLAQKICEYADLRVGPHGVLSMEARIEDARIRYQHKFDSTIDEVRARFAQLLDAARGVEEQLFAGLSIGPSEITEEGVSAFFEEFRKYEIKEGALS
jgi:hypothetical protein